MEHSRRQKDVCVRGGGGGGDIVDVNWGVGGWCLRTIPYLVCKVLPSMFLLLSELLNLRQTSVLLQRFLLLQLLQFLSPLPVGRRKRGRERDGRREGNGNLVHVLVGLTPCEINKNTSSCCSLGVLPSLQSMSPLP